MIEEATINNVVGTVPLLMITDYITDEDDPAMIEALKVLKKTWNLTKDDICMKALPDTGLSKDPLWDAQHNNVTYIYRKRKTP